MFKIINKVSKNLILNKYLFSTFAYPTHITDVLYLKKLSPY